MKTGIRFMCLLLVVVGSCLSAMARVGNQFEFSTEEADMILTITSEDPKEAELTTYTRKGDWPITLIVPGTAIDDERDIEFTITSIGRGVFKNAPIREVKFPKSIKKLGNGAFSNALLLGVDLRGIEEIGSACFSYHAFSIYTVYSDSFLHGYQECILEYSGCLQYVVLGSSLKVIGEDVFDHQDLNLKIVSYCPEPPQIMDVDYGMFSTIYVPEEYMAAYEDAIDKADKWRSPTIAKFENDMLLCGVANRNQTKYYRYESAHPDVTSREELQLLEELKSFRIDYEIPCVATSTLCEVNNELGPQPEPAIRWMTSNDNAGITEDGVIKGIKPGEVYAECYFSLDEPNVTAMARTPFDFYDPNSGVESIGTDDTHTTRIFDLNGREVTGSELDHGIYIRVTRSGVEKIAL